MRCFSENQRRYQRMQCGRRQEVAQRMYESWSNVNESGEIQVKTVLMDAGRNANMKPKS